MNKNTPTPAPKNINNHFESFPRVTTVPFGWDSSAFERSASRPPQKVTPLLLKSKIILKAFCSCKPFSV